MNKTESLTKPIEFEHSNRRVLDNALHLSMSIDESNKWTEEATVKIHILRCVECGFESVDKLKFDTHLPCAISELPITYTVYKCVICSTISTSKLLMEEHKKIYHADETNVPLVEIQDHLKPQLVNKDMTETDGKCNPSTTFNIFPNKAFNNSVNNFNAIDFSKKVAPAPPIGNQFEFGTRSVPVDSIDSSQKTIFESFLNNWKKPSFASPHIQYNKRENILPNLYNLAMISSILQKQQLHQQNQICPFSCAICKSSFPTNEDLVRHVYFLHNLCGATDPSTIFPSMVSNNSNFLKTPQAPPTMSSSFISDQFWLNNMKLKSYNPPSVIPPIQMPLVCPICKSMFVNFLQLDSHISQVHSNNVNVMGQATVKPEYKNDTHQDFYSEFRRAMMSTNDCVNNHDIKLNSQNNHINPDGKKMDPNTSNKGVTNKNQCSFDEKKKSSKSDNETSTLDGKETRNVSISPDNIFSNLKSTPQSQLIVHNTMRKTKSDLKVINRYLNQVKNEHRPVHEISPEELNVHLQDFVMNAKKKDGHEYEPESLKAFVHSLERFLKAFHNYPVSVLKDQQFHGTRAMLHQRLQELRLRSKSLNSPNGVNSIAKFSLNHTSQSIQDLIKYDVIGHETPQALINTLWLINRVLFHIGGVHKHKNLLWGQFSLTQVFGQTCLQYYPNKINFTNHSIKDMDLDMFGNKERETPISVGRSDSRLPVDAIEIFKIYANMRPIECRNVSDPFYLCPDPIWKKGGSWFKSINAGFQYISKIPRLMGFKSNTAIKNSVGLQTQSSMATTNKDSEMFEYADHSQIIDVESQTNDDDDDDDNDDNDINDEHDDSHSSVPCTEEMEDTITTTVNTTTTPITTTQTPGNEQYEAVDMTSKICAHNL